MTREEAIAVFKAFMDNPLFSDVHKAAFSIAIHDIKAYHKWDLNELVLTQKDNEQEPILDKIRAEIKALPIAFTSSFEMKQDCLKIIDKYKAETENEDGEY